MTNKEIKNMRLEIHNLQNNKNYGPQNESDRAKLIFDLRKKLIEETGWSRGKKFPDGNYSYLER